MVSTNNLQSCGGVLEGKRNWMKRVFWASGTTRHIRMKAVRYWAYMSNQTECVFNYHRLQDAHKHNMLNSVFQRSATQAIVVPKWAEHTCKIIKGFCFRTNLKCSFIFYEIFKWNIKSCFLSINKLCKKCKGRIWRGWRVQRPSLMYFPV